MTGLSITTPMRAALIADEDIRRLVGDNIFPLCAPAGTNGDIIVYAREDYARISSKMGVAGYPTVRIDVCSSDYDRGVAIAEAADKVMRTVRLSDTAPLRGCNDLIRSTEEYEVDSGYYVQVLIYQIL